MSSNKIASNIYCLFPSPQNTKCSDGGFSCMNVGLQLLVLLCLYQRWVMIHMLVRDGRRGPDACWPVREMWQRLVCRDKLETVACSSQSLQGLAETPTGSCLFSLSFISFSSTLSIFHVSSISRSLPCFVALTFPPFMFFLLISALSASVGCSQIFYALTFTWIFSNNSISCARFVAAHCLRQYPT